jgi:hypothetical protein
MKWAGYAVHVGEKINAYKTFVGKHEGKKPHGKLIRVWKDNIKMDFK